MIRIETDIAIAAPPEAVWAVLTDLDGHARWNPFLVSMRGRLKKGARLAVRARLPNATRVVGFRPIVTVLEPGRMLAWKGGLPLPGLFTGVHYVRLAPAGAAGTHLVHGEAFEGLVVSAMGRDRIEAFKPAFHAMNRALAVEVEARGRAGSQPVSRT